ncbi:MAG TPA: glycosyltransferase family 39 protein [Nevskiaceae bacterium]|nr:glycosyltransferase family 39 protein [Nevskiaceae bacterium]
MLAKFFTKNKIEFLILLAVLLTASFFRFYRLNDFAIFLGDEGRDTLIVKRIIVDHKFTLLGPMTSVGNMYLGPIYYYLMIIPLWLARLNPIGPAVMVALFGVITVFLIYKLGRDLFNSTVGLIAASLYAISQAIISHTRFSWNPNPMPLFSTLAIYFLFKLMKDNKGWWFVPLGLSLATCFQLHYMSVVFIFSIIVMLLLFKPKIDKKWWFFGIGSFLFVCLPIFIFELRHNFIIFQGLLRFLKEEDKIGFSLTTFLKKAIFVYWRLFYRFMAAERRNLSFLLSFLGVIPLLSFFRSKGNNLGIKIIVGWLLIGILGVSFYTGDLHDHYFGFLFPIPFLLIGLFLVKLFECRLRWLGMLIFLTLLLINFANLDIVAGQGPNYQIERARELGKIIGQDAPQDRFNLALISPTHDFRAMNYRYFVEVFGARPEGYENYTDIKNLYVIIESGKYEPGKTTSWEIASFGPADIAKSWSFDFGYQIVKLEKKK